MKLEIKDSGAIVGTYLLCLQKCFFGSSPKIDKSFSIAQWGIVGIHQKSLLQAAQADVVGIIWDMQAIESGRQRLE